VDRLQERKQIMGETTHTPAHGLVNAPLWRRTWPMALLGTIAVLSLLLQPVPAELVAKAPELAALSPLAQRTVLLANPWILVLVAAVVGAALAHRVGLASVLAGTARAQGWSGVAVQAAGMGLALGLLLAAVDAVVAPLLGPGWQALVASALALRMLPPWACCTGAWPKR
jgi:hypothetical protein